MSETLEYIEAFFEKKLSDAEQQVFEERCIQDEDFAGEVAFYITSREAIRQTLLEQKRALWSDNKYDSKKIEVNIPVAAEVPIRKMTSRKWMHYAAASLLLLFAVYFFYPEKTPQQFANSYVNNKLSRISQTMDGSTDSLQKAIVFYNSGDFDNALPIFQNFYRTHPDNTDALEYLGRTYLMKKDYAMALKQFDELGNKKLHSNPGVFLKAITLLERNNEDKSASRKLLEQVVEENLKGSKEAGKWLKKWK